MVENAGTVTQLKEEGGKVTQLKKEDVDYGSGDGGGVGHHLAGAADTAGSPAGALQTGIGRFV